jgi:hypothetical protein
MSPLAKFLIGAVALGAALLAGCKSQPIYDVVAEPIPVVGNRPLTMDDIQRAIMRGGARAGWTMTPDAPGRMSGRYQAAAHSAMVDIVYDSKAYNIKMRETSLRSDGASVHQLYNRWVQSLDRSIRVELSAAGQ